VLAWLLLLVTLACCAAGLLVTPAITGPVILAVLAEGAAFTLAYPLGYATIKLVLSLRQPAAAAGRPRRLRRRAAPMGAGDRSGVTLPLLLVPDGRLPSRRWRLGWRLPWWARSW
jgi:hypothetical protein